MLFIHIKKEHYINKTGYICPQCPGKSFGLRSLVDHFAKEHTNENIIYRCKECDKLASSYKGLRKHYEKVHEQITLDKTP